MVVLFVLWVLAARHWAEAVGVVITQHGRLAVVVFVLTTVVAVLMPMLTNLPLVPFAALAWGPWWAAALLLLGWTEDRLFKRPFPCRLHPEHGTRRA